MRLERRANGVLVAVVFLGAVVLLASGIGVAMIAGNSAGDQSESAQPTTTPTTAATPTQQPQKDVEVGFERDNESVWLVAHGGDDLDSITGLSIDGATVNDPFTPDSDRPQAAISIDPPTTVTITASFEDGTEQVVAELTFE